MPNSPVTGETMEKSIFRTIESGPVEIGDNFLIQDGVVYCVTMWFGGGVADRRIWRPGDIEYERMYKWACGIPATLYGQRSI